MLQDHAGLRPALSQPAELTRWPRFDVSTARCLYAIVLVGAALRVFPVWFGLPYQRARPDEETAIGHAMAVLQGNPNPQFFHWPSLTFYLLAMLFEAASWVRWAFFVNPVLTDVERLLLARTFVALAGALTIVVLFKLTTRIADSVTGLVAAAFLAVAILHVRESHFAMTDVLMTLLVTLSLALLLRAQDTAMTAPQGTRWFGEFAVAGLAGGLAASTKYSAAVVIAAMGAVELHWLVHSRKTLWAARTWTPPIAYLAAFGCGFLIGTPYALLDFPKFSADLRFDFTHLSEGHGPDLGRGWSYHVTRSLPYGVGPLIFLSAIAGVVPLIRHYGRPALVVGAFAAAFYAAMGNGLAVFFRYVLPLVPIVCLSAAVAVRHAGFWLAARSRLSNGMAVALLTALIGGPALVNSAWFDVLLAKTDTRVLAARWLRPRLHREDTLHETGSLYAQLDLWGARFHRWEFDTIAQSFGDPDGGLPDWVVVQESPLSAYTNVPPELRQIVRDKYALAYAVRATKERTASAAVYDLQDAFFMPIAGFTTVERPGPNITIYRRADLPLPELAELRREK